MTTQKVEVKTLIPPELARRQELSLAAIQLHTANIADLAEHDTVRGDHKRQLLAAVEQLREAIELLGPVEEAPLDAEMDAAPSDELAQFLTDTQKLRVLKLTK